MRVYRVLQESDARSRLDIATRRGLPPLVGREHEVGVLFDRWQQVTAGQGQVVVLSGEAGIGKSRLVQVLKEQIADAAHIRLECRSSPYYQHTALYPLIDLFERALQAVPDDAMPDKLAALEQLLGQYRLALAETVPLFASLLSVPVPVERYAPLHWPPQRQRQKTLESLVAMLLEQAEQQPVLFILEDLHWMDPTTLEFLDLLIGHIPTAAIYAVLTCRPAFQRAWSPRSYLTAVTVNRLSREQIARLAEQVAGGKRLPADVLQHIVEKTDGVPLFVEEMTKAVLESGALQEGKGTYDLVGSLGALAIPATLHDSLMARLDRLIAAKGVAQYASVIGRQFSYTLLQTVAVLDDTVLARELGLLVEAELVYQRGLPPQATYTFKHALIQDIAYQSLLRRTRQRYHQRIAQVLETQFPETMEAQSELLAHHFTQADLFAQAVEYWQRAGQRAVERSAHLEAISHLTTALELLKTLPDTASRSRQELALQLGLGASLMVTKGYSATEVAQTYSRQQELCLQVGEPFQVAQVLFGLFAYNVVRGHFTASLALGEPFLAFAQRQQDATVSFMAHAVLGGTLRVDPVNRTARAEAGLTWDEYNHETQAFGLASTGGVVSTTGIAGLTLGGGLGWLMGKHGLSCDNLLSADVVTADGRFLTASASEHAELFWGLRGGGGNFGVVTSFEYRLHPVDSVLGGIVLHPMANAKDVLRFYREYARTCPDELTAFAAMMTSPAGDPVVAIVVGYIGDLEEGERLVVPVREFGPPIADLIGPMSYVQLNTMLDEAFPYGGVQRYWKSSFLKELGDEVLDILIDRAATMTSPMSMIGFFHVHGAACRVSPTETAFGLREDQWDYDIISQWLDPAESEHHIKWTREVWTAVEPFATGGVYVNHLDAEEATRVRAAYGPNYERLLALKKTYDPTNLFRLNQNIKPMV